MLTIKIVQNESGEGHKRNYLYEVYVNGKEIDTGEVLGHDRRNNYLMLLYKLVAQNIGRIPEKWE